MKNLNTILPYIIHDMHISHIDTIVFLYAENDNEYKPLFKDKTDVRIEDVLRCRKPCEVVEYDTKNHILIVKPFRCSIYDFFLECQVERLLDCGFINMNIIWDDYSSKKAMNDTILSRLRHKHRKNLSLKEFAKTYGVEWFLEV